MFSILKLQSEREPYDSTLMICLWWVFVTEAQTSCEIRSLLLVMVDNILGKYPPILCFLFVHLQIKQTIGTAQFWLTNKPVHIIFQFINIQKMDADFFFFINASFVQNWIKVVIFLIFGTVGSCLKISKHQLFLCEDSLKRPGLMKQQNEQNGNNLWWK